VWSRISNALKRLGFRSRNFLAQLVFETSRACTIRVRRSSLGRPWNALGEPGRLCHRNSRSRPPVTKRISDRGEPDPERADQGSAGAFGRRKSNTGGDRSPPGSKALEDVAATAKPETILGWYRKLIANKFDGSKSRRSVGRPKVDQETERLVVQMARENPSWGYTRDRARRNADQAMRYAKEAEVQRNEPVAARSGESSVCVRGT